MSEIAPQNSDDLGVFTESAPESGLERVAKELQQLRLQLESHQLESHSNPSSPPNRKALEVNPALQRYLDGSALAESLDSIRMPGRASQEQLEQIESEALADLFGTRVIGGNL